MDWETGAPPREDDPYRSYCEEGELRDGDEWPEPSTSRRSRGPRPGAVRGRRDSHAMAPGPVLASLADRIEQGGLERAG